MKAYMDEREPFPAFLETLRASELAVLRHEAIQVKDDATKGACDREFKRREVRAYMDDVERIQP